MVSDFPMENDVTMIGGGRNLLRRPPFTIEDTTKRADCPRRLADDTEFNQDTDRHLLGGTIGASALEPGLFEGAALVGCRTATAKPIPPGAMRSSSFDSRANMFLHGFHLLSV